MSSSSSNLDPSYYHLLGIDQDATLKEIEKAYKRQALIHHPDRNPNDSQSQSTNKFQNLAEAYEVLRDPTKRRKYDLKLVNLKTKTKVPPTNVHPSHPPPQPNPPQSRRSSTFDLFGYPGETPRYVPAPNRRPASTTPSFRIRARTFSQQSSQPTQTTPSNPHSSHQPIYPSSASSNHPTDRQPFSQKIKLKDLDTTAAPHKPFSQKINLRDLDSLDIILNNRLPSRHSFTPASTAPHQTRPDTRSSSIPHPSIPCDHPAGISTSAPDPYLTFERAWGKTLDEIVDEIADRRDFRSTPHPPNRKSLTDPTPLHSNPRIVHRSSTVRSADSDYRSSSFDHHPSRRPRSAGGESLRDWIPTPTDHRLHHTQPISRQRSPPPSINREAHQRPSPVDPLGHYLPSNPSVYQLRAHHHRRMSTGPEPLAHHHPQPSPQRFYRQQAHHHHHHHHHHQMSVSPPSTFPAGSSQRTCSPSSSSSPSANSIQDYSNSATASYNNSYPQRPSSRTRSSSVNPPSDQDRHHHRPSQTAQNVGLGREFREVIIRFERERDGSTRLSKEFKSRTVDLDGTVHDRYRRQRAAAVK